MTYPTTQAVDNPNDRTKKLQALLLAGGAFVVVFILWQMADVGLVSALLYPFRLLVTFVHEAGHGLSAILTGGRFISFAVNDNGSGVAFTAGGNRAVILTMGYLGAALFGALLLFTANRATSARLVAFMTGLFFIGVGLLFTGSSSGILVLGVLVGAALWGVSEVIERETPNRARWFQAGAVLALGVTLLLIRQNTALVTGIIAGMALLALGTFAARPITLFVLNFLALIVGFNALNDILGLWNNQSARLGNTPNDALALAQFTNLPTQFWILVWIGLAFAAMGISIYFAFIRPIRRNE
jgi:hypothetical protein